MKLDDKDIDVAFRTRLFRIDDFREESEKFLSNMKLFIPKLATGIFTVFARREKSLAISYRMIESMPASLYIFAVNDDDTEKLVLDSFLEYPEISQKSLFPERAKLDTILKSPLRS
jgi:hypothetical protein